MRFTDALDRSLEEIQRPPNLPRGHYIFQVTKHPEVDDFTGSDGVTSDRVNFTCAVVRPHDDVDPDELEEYGEVAGVQLRKTIWIADGDADKARHDKGMFQLKQFLKTIGVDEGSIGEGLAASVGGQFLAEVVHTPDKENSEIMYDNMGKVAPVE